MSIEIAQDFGQSEPPDEMEHLDAVARFDMRVAHEVDRIRIRDAAHAKITAEKEAHLDFTGLYFDRAALNDLPVFTSLISGILPRHSYGILRGRDHTLKSFAAIDWACCLATGKPWQNHKVEPTPVLYIAGEGAHGLAKRVDAWEYAWGETVPSEMLTIRRLALNMYQPGPAFAELLRRIEERRYGFVVIDTLRRVSGAADGNGSEMGAVIDNIDLVKNATDNGSVLVLSHTDKHDTDSRGYSGIEDDADFVWHAKRDEMHLRLKLTKMKDGPDGREITLLATPTLESLVLSSAAGVPTQSNTEAQIKILDTMREFFPDGAYSTALLKATGLPDSTFYRAKNELRDAGQLVNTGTPKRPYFELPALDLDSQDLPPDNDPDQAGNSHTSQDLPLDLPTTSHHSHDLRSGSTGSRSKTDTPEETP